MANIHKIPRAACEPQPRAFASFGAYIPYCPDREAWGVTPRELITEAESALSLFNEAVPYAHCAILRCVVVEDATATASAGLPTRTEQAAGIIARMSETERNDFLRAAWAFYRPKRPHFQKGGAAA